MKNKFQKIVENLEEQEILMVGDQTFLNEIILDEFIPSFILGTLTFLKSILKKLTLQTALS